MDGLAYAWGYNTYGQLGDNSRTDRSVPTSVSSTILWKQITGYGNNYTAAIDGTNGLAYAWGSNSQGQLGDNSTTSRSVPTSVSSAISWKQIACGAISTLAIDGATGFAYAWGNNSAGQLGDNTTTNKSVPTSVSSTISWKQIACGAYYFTLAINLTNGFAFAWGFNNYGQLGNNSTTSISGPTSVSSVISWKQIACGDYSVAAIDGATGLAYAWGRNDFGQLGDNSRTDKSVPTSVSSAISWKQIACGGIHTVAINGANGLAYAWGGNSNGQLGDNSTTSRSVPTSVSSAISWKQIACGTYFTLAIDGATGLAYAWGNNTYGQLGDNSTTSRSVPTSVSSVILWKQIACGGNHTFAIEDTMITSTVCWGHVTEATETLTRSFGQGYDGSGAIFFSSDDELVELNGSEYMESEIVQTGSVTVTLTKNKYVAL